MIWDVGMKLIIASNNEHKIREIKQILGGIFSEILSLNEAGIDHETVEDGTTFSENALKKAREIAEISGQYAIADDSGLCVDALDGAPGIYSARFCGVHGDDDANNRLLLQKLENTDIRTAHYTAAIALVTPDGKELCTEGYLYGEILRIMRGNGGFGYDPMFKPDGFSCTLAEITPEQKNSISHRADGLKKMVELIKKEGIM